MYVELAHYVQANCKEFITSTKPMIIEDLTSGTIFTFQVRALGRLGFTNWSDAVKRMVT